LGLSRDDAAASGMEKRQRHALAEAGGLLLSFYKEFLALC
jgi:hypothetical protein